jgi:hypothetical protein
MEAVHEGVGGCGSRQWQAPSSWASNRWPASWPSQQLLAFRTNSAPCNELFFQTCLEIRQWTNVMYSLWNPNRQSHCYRTVTHNQLDRDRPATGRLKKFLQCSQGQPQDCRLPTDSYLKNHKWNVITCLVANDFFYSSPWSFVNRYQRFGETRCLHVLSRQQLLPWWP